MIYYVYILCPNSSWPFSPCATYSLSLSLSLTCFCFLGAYLFARCLHFIRLPSFMWISRLGTPHHDTGLARLISILSGSQLLHRIRLSASSAHPAHVELDHSKNGNEILNEWWWRGWGDEDIVHLNRFGINRNTTFVPHNWRKNYSGHYGIKGKVTTIGPKVVAWVGIEPTIRAKVVLEHKWAFE